MTNIDKIMNDVAISCKVCESELLKFKKLKDSIYMFNPYFIGLKINSISGDKYQDGELGIVIAQFDNCDNVMESSSKQGFLVMFLSDIVKSSNEITTKTIPSYLVRHESIEPLKNYNYEQFLAKFLQKQSEQLFL